MPSPQRRWRLVTCAAWALAAVAATAAAQAPRPVRVPPPQTYSLPTKDGVQIKITYYPSTAGQRAVPVILLHDFNESRAVFEPLAKELQNPRPELRGALPPGPPIEPRAVVTVDLRGHGESKTAFDAAGEAYELDANRFELEDFQDMVFLDMEAVRGFLVEQNDAGQLNLNKLCVAGAGMGANVALTFAARDWAIPSLAARKQGQDVKALVLLSPRRNFHGLSTVEALKYPPVQRQLSIYLAYGAGDPKVAKDCANMVKIFSRFHPEPPGELVAERKDFFVFAPNTQRQGSELITSPDFGLSGRIAAFIEMRLGRREFPYVVRKR